MPRAQRGLIARVILEDALEMLVPMTVANRRGMPAAFSLDGRAYVPALGV
jgi:hypothetical protein